MASPVEPVDEPPPRSFVVPSGAGRGASCRWWSPAAAPDARSSPEPVSCGTMMPIASTTAATTNTTPTRWRGERMGQPHRLAVDRGAAAVGPDRHVTSPPRRSRAARPAAASGAGCGVGSARAPRARATAGTPRAPGGRRPSPRRPGAGPARARATGRHLVPPGGLAAGGRHLRRHDDGVLAPVARSSRGRRPATVSTTRLRVPGSASAGSLRRPGHAAACRAGRRVRAVSARPAAGQGCRRVSSRSAVAMTGPVASGRGRRMPAADVVATVSPASSSSRSWSQNSSCGPRCAGEPLRRRKRENSPPRGSARWPRPRRRTARPSATCA